MPRVAPERLSDDAKAHLARDVPEADGVEGSPPPDYRTRWLYFAKFAWGSCFGRFMSLYYAAEGLNEEEVGTVFALGSLTGPFISTAVGLLADRWAARSAAARGRCFGACVLAGTAVFSLQAWEPRGVSRFTVMLVARVLLNGCNTSADVLVNAITVQGLRDRKRFGQERLYGAVSWAVMHVALGLLIDRYGCKVQHFCIVPAAALCLLVLCCLGHPREAPSSDPRAAGQGLEALADNATLRALLRSYASSWMTMAFMLYAVALGYGMTIVEHLIFLLFTSLGASNFICGLSVVVTVVFEIPLFAMSPRLLNKLGASGLLAVAGLCYSVRVVGYTLCPGGWYVLFFEPLHGVTIATFATASVELVASITPAALAATGQALFSFVRGSLGASAGNFVSGLVIRTYGESTCYRLSAVVVLAGLATYASAACRMRRLSDAAN